MKIKSKRKQARHNLRPTTGVTILASCLLVAVVMGQLFFNVESRKTKILGASTKLSIDKIINLINIERAKVNLGPVSLNEQLSQAAYHKGENMFLQNYWAHNSPAGVEPWSFLTDAGYNYSSAGENLGRDFDNEESLVAAWMASDSHRANILNRKFSETGIAVLDGSIDNQAVLLIVNFFAQPPSATGLVPQVEIYQTNSDNLVAAGEVIAHGSVLASTSQRLSLISLGLALGIGIALTLVIINLRRFPGGRQRHQ